MKQTNSLVRWILVGFVLTLMTPSCQKDSMLVNQQDGTSIAATPRLKTEPNVGNLDKLLTLITEKVQAGEISQGNGNSLIAKVNSAKSNLEKGQLKAAENVLKAFSNQVTSLIADGVISEILGNELNQLAYEVFNPPTWKCGDQFTDARDGHVYKSVQIGNQCWMGENMAYLPSVTRAIYFGGVDYYVHGYEGTSTTEAKASTNYAEYGVLYSWPAAMGEMSSSNSIPSGVKGICPDGWHLPSDNEWKVLEIHLGMTPEDADKMDWRNSGNVGTQIKSSYGWIYDWNGLNTSGFNAKPGGQHYIYYFSHMPWMGLFWTSTAMNEDEFYGRALMAEASSVGRSVWGTRWAFSVRCLKD